MARCGTERAAADAWSGVPQRLQEHENAARYAGKNWIRTHGDQSAALQICPDFRRGNRVLRAARGPPGQTRAHALKHVVAHVLDEQWPTSDARELAQGAGTHVAIEMHQEADAGGRIEE